MARGGVDDVVGAGCGRVEATGEGRTTPGIAGREERPASSSNL